MSGNLTRFVSELPDKDLTDLQDLSNKHHSHIFWLRIAWSITLDRQKLEIQLYDIGHVSLVTLVL